MAKSSVRLARRALNTKPPQKNPSRERLQAELRHLKTLVEELEREWGALELKRGQAIAREEEEAEKNQDSTLWCREARLELKKRRHVERINARLRQTLDEQIKVAKGLTDLLSRQLTLLSSAYASVQESHESTTFDVFLKDVDAAYRMTDVVMEAIDWDASRLHWLIETKTTESQGRPQLVMEMVTQFDHPSHAFIPNKGVPSTWQHLIQFLQRPPFVTDELVVQDQWLIVRYRRNYSFCSRQVRAYVHTAIKCFLEDNREVRVWRSRVVAVGDAQDKQSSAFVDYVGWLTYEPLHQDDLTKGVTTRLCSHFVPGFFDSETGDVVRDGSGPRIGDLVSCVVSALKMDISHVSNELSRGR